MTRHQLELTAMLPDGDWKPLPDDPALWISTDGRVWSQRRRRLLKPHVHRPDGRRGLPGKRHLSVRARGRRAVLLHRALWAAHRGPIPAGMLVLHNNGDETDNRLDNLRLGSHADNATDKVRHGRSTRGERNRHARLTADQVRDVFARWQRGERPCDAAKRLGFTAGGIRDILAGRRWGWLTEDLRSHQPRQQIADSGQSDGGSTAPSRSPARGVPENAETAQTAPPGASTGKAL